VAGSASGDPPASFGNGRIEGQQDSSDVREGAVIDEQTLADCDQALSDADQTSADADQTSADSDQLAADRDQAASDRDLVHGADPRAHELSHDIRERTRRARERAARERDETGRTRLSAANERDAIAHRRDLAAQLRDEAARARAAAMAELDAAFEHPDDPPGHGSADAIIRAAGQRRRAAERRAQAAAYRQLAAEDRVAAARDRELSAQERLDAHSDREALAAEVHHEQARRRESLRHQHRAEALAGTLQHALSPPRLPSIPGLDVAVHHEPFALAEVGGDFYDLFALADVRAAFLLGDVCGKGAQAAATTALARYTMRTAAMLHESPVAILGDLNAALHTAGADAPLTCTAVYGQIDMHASTASITLAVGGHPPPLVVRAGGDVEATRARGTILGVVEQPVFETCEVTLAPGDALVVYSDGILDAAIGAAPVDERRIIDVLTGSRQAGAADLVGRLLGSLRGIDRALRDDVALLALRWAPAA
jgi:serine phosphatase RsbU (regulator of sigma subunit)